MRKPTSAEFSNRLECCVISYRKAQAMARDYARRGIPSIVQPYWYSYSMPVLRYVPDASRVKGYRISYM